MRTNLAGLIFLVACVYPLNLRAQAPPLPTALRTATTVYIVNAGVHTRVVEKTVAALMKWGRFRLVPDSVDSELTLTLSNQPPRQVFNWATGQNYPVNGSFFSFTSTSDGAVLYGAAFGNDPDGEFKKLRKRLDVEK